MNHASSCPTADRLRGLLLGQLSEAELSIVVAHLESCPACLAALRAMEATDTVLQAWQQIGETPPPMKQPDPLLSSLYSRIRQLNTEAPIEPAIPAPGGQPASVRRRLRVLLQIVEGPNQGRKFSFSQHDTFIVGRAIQAHFRLPENDRYFSRLHLMIEVNPPLCRLIDLHSRNGTFVNGQRVATADLKDGDQIRGGKTLIHVRLQEFEEPIPAEDTSRPSPPLPAALTPRPVASNKVSPGVQIDQRATSCPACHAPLSGAISAMPSGDSALCHDCRQQALTREQLVPGYLIAGELGRGGMGVVYLAERQSDGSLCALKTIKPAVTGSRRDIDRFLREAGILEQLHHPHIVGCREMGDVAGKLLYFAMDYVRGADAARLLKREGPLPVRRAVPMLEQLLEALEYAHAAGIVHRDIKPANLLVADGPTEHVRLADFGLARVYQSSRLSGLTMTGQIGGTLTFMAPEQISDFRNAPPSVDQFAAAATLYYLLTGDYVHESHADQRKALLSILEGRIVPLTNRRADLPPELASIIHTALSREPRDRFADVAELRQRLRRFREAHDRPT
ncbi:MAG: protein kinase [Pirellulales bacterium]